MVHGYAFLNLATADEAEDFLHAFSFKSHSIRGDSPQAGGSLSTPSVVLSICSDDDPKDRSVRRNGSEAIFRCGFALVEFNAAVTCEAAEAGQRTGLTICMQPA